MQKYWWRGNICVTANYTETTHKKKLAEYEKIAVRFKSDTPYDTVSLVVIKSNATRGKKTVEDAAKVAQRVHHGDSSVPEREDEETQWGAALKALEPHLLAPASLK